MLRFSPDRLRRARERRQLSPTEFAARLGKSYVSISAYERGARVPPTSVLARAAAVLCCSIADLFDDEAA